jgi:hypothetical protein
VLEDETMPIKGADETVKTFAEHRFGIWRAGSSNWWSKLAFA